MASTSTLRQRRCSAPTALLAEWLAESKQSKLVPMSRLLSGLRCATAAVHGPYAAAGSNGADGAAEALINVRSTAAPVECCDRELI